MEPSHDIKGRIDRFLSETEMSATRFGKEAVGDPNFVFNLRAGREPRSRTAARALTFISKRSKSHDAVSQNNGSAA